jgi:hypothetical protein
MKTASGGCGRSATSRAAVAFGAFAPGGFWSTYAPIAVYDGVGGRMSPSIALWLSMQVALGQDTGAAAGSAWVDGEGLPARCFAPWAAAAHPAAVGGCVEWVEAGVARGEAARGTVTGGRVGPSGFAGWTGEVGFAVDWSAEAPPSPRGPRDDPALVLVDDPQADAVVLEVWAYLPRREAHPTVMEGMRAHWRGGGTAAGAAAGAAAREAALRRQRFEAGRAAALAVPVTGVDRVAVDPATGGARLRGPVLALRRLRDAGVALRSVGRSREDCGVDPVSGLADGAVSLDGEELADLLQTRPLYDAGAWGQGVRFLLVEPEGAALYRRHPGFLDDRGRRRVFNCGAGMSAACCAAPTTSGCAEPDPIALGGAGAHATAVASLLVGDVSRGQHPGFVAGSAGAEARSGVARRASAWGVGEDFAQHAALALAVDADLVSRSASERQSTCFGDSAWDRHVNGFYTAGIGWFNSAGDLGGLGGACNVGTGAAAIGSMAVGANAYAGGALGVTPSASSGGDGRRTVMDLGGPTPVSFPYPHYARPLHHGLPGQRPTWHDFGADWERDLQVGEQSAGADDQRGTFGGSSAATPLVAGAAGVFQRWYRANVGREIDEPGLLYALMLLMGDGAAASAPADAAGFVVGTVDRGASPVTGAGTPRLRTLDGAGLDDPAGWGAGSVCVPHGGTVSLPVNPDPVTGANEPLPPQVDVVRVVTWLFDDQHDQTGQLDDVDLWLEREDTAGRWVTATDLGRRAEDLGADNKRRVVHRDVWPERYRLRLRGRAVAGWPFDGCGWNEARVYYAWLYEDTARDDTPGCLAPG